MSLHFDDNNNAENVIAFATNAVTNKIVTNLCVSEDEGDGQQQSVKLEKDYKFALAPRKLSEKERSVLFVAGESGSGKSYFTREYVKRYNQMFPNNPIYLILYLDEDKTLDAYKKIIRLNCMTDEFLYDCQEFDLKAEFGNSFVIFDDIDSIAEKKAKEIIFALLNKLLRIGRHFNTSVAYVGHELYSNHELKVILNESHTITFFSKILEF